MPVCLSSGTEAAAIVFDSVIIVGSAANRTGFPSRVRIRLGISANADLHDRQNKIDVLDILLCSPPTDVDLAQKHPAGRHKLGCGCNSLVIKPGRAAALMR